MFSLKPTLLFLLINIKNKKRIKKKIDKKCFQILVNFANTLIILNIYFRSLNNNSKHIKIQLKIIQKMRIEI